MVWEMESTRRKQLMLRDSGSERKNVCCAVGAAGAARRRCGDPIRETQEGSSREAAAQDQRLPASLLPAWHLRISSRFLAHCLYLGQAAWLTLVLLAQKQASFLHTGECKHVRGRTGQRSQSRSRMSAQSLPHALRQPEASEARSRD